MSTDCADDDLIDEKRDGAAPREQDESVKQYNTSRNGENGKKEGGDDACAMSEIDNIIHILKQILVADMKKKKCGDRQGFQKALFQAPPPREDCPICAHRLPLENGEITYMPCCGKTICNGCDFQSDMMDAKKVCEKSMRSYTGREKMQKEYDDSRHCAFCRRSKIYSDDEYCNLLRERVKNDDGIACEMLAYCHRKGDRGLKVNKVKAYHLLVRAVEIGQPSASFTAAAWIMEDYGINCTHTIRFLVDTLMKVAAIGGCIDARCELASFQLDAGNKEIAVKHWKISAAAGDQNSVNSLMKCFRDGTFPKDELAATLRAFQAACDEIWTEERAAAAKREDGAVE